MSNIITASGGVALTVTSVPLGGYASVFSYGDSYKLVGQSIPRASYPEMSSAFPRKNALSTLTGITATVGGLNVNTMAGTFANGLYVIMQGIPASEIATCLTSTDGLNWQTRTMPYALAWEGVAYGIVGGVGKWVAVGTAAGNNATSSYATSADGLSWVAGPVGLPSRYYGAMIWSPVQGLFIALNSTPTLAGATCVTSPDGITWTSRAMPSNQTWNALSVSDSGVIVAVSVGGLVARSVDGINWSLVSGAPVSGTSQRSITFGRGLFVIAASSTPGIITSPDGLTWTARSVIGSGQGGQAIYADGIFVYQSSGQNVLWTSKDGILWNLYPSAFSLTFTTIIYGNGVVIVGPNSASSVVAAIYAENDTDSQWLYISGTAGQYVRVR